MRHMGCLLRNWLQSVKTCLSPTFEQLRWEETLSNHKGNYYVIKPLVLATLVVLAHSHMTRRVGRDYMGRHSPQRILLLLLLWNLQSELFPLKIPIRHLESTWKQQVTWLSRRAKLSLFREWNFHFPSQVLGTLLFISLAVSIQQNAASSCSLELKWSPDEVSHPSLLRMTNCFWWNLNINETKV